MTTRYAQSLNEYVDNGSESDTGTSISRQVVSISLLFLICYSLC